MADGPRIVTAKEVAQTLERNLEIFVDCVRETFIEYSSGSAQNPLRSWVQTDAASGELIF